MREMHEAPPPPDWSLLQKILNERWPLQDQRGEWHARGIPDQVANIPVNARVVWERDGEEIIHGHARRWINAYVFVAFHDLRRPQGHGAWLPASDVTRQPGEPA
jgi:hypothetical protein